MTPRRPGASGGVDLTPFEFLDRQADADGHASVGHSTGGCCDSCHQRHKPRSHDTSRIAWAKLMARVGEEFPFECPNCGGDIRLGGNRRQEPAHAK